MSFQIAFPFSTISNSAKEVSGAISVTMDNREPVVVKFTQEPNSVMLDIDDQELYNRKFCFKFSVIVNDPTATVLISTPVLTHAQPLNAYLRFAIPSDNIEYKKGWNDFLLKPNQSADLLVSLTTHETTNSVVEGLAKNITFREKITYVNSDLSTADNIEYYLGKDRLKNLYFKAEIPTAWSIPARIHTPPPQVNSIAIGFFRGDKTEYYYNNLGYRSGVDFVKELDKPVILCLSDSDGFGVGVEYNNIWPSLIQSHTDMIVWNMSIPGISNDGLTRVATQTIQALGNQVSAVLTQYAPMSLREFVSKEYKAGVHTHRNYNLPYADWWDHIDWQSNNYNFNKNKLLLENICARFNIRYYDLYINKSDTKVPYDFIEYGVYSSIGPETHKAIANYFIKKLDSKPSLYQQMQS